MNQELNVKTYVDLRSYTEIREDEFVQSGHILPSTAKVYDTQRQNMFSHYFNKLYLIIRLNLWQSKELKSILYSIPVTASPSSTSSSISSDGSIATATQRYTHFIPLVSYPQIALGVFNYMPFNSKVSKLVVYNVYRFILILYINLSFVYSIHIYVLM